MVSEIKVAVISALQEELSFLLNKPDFGWERSKMLKGGFPCHIGTLSKGDKAIRVAAVTQPLDEMGLSDAAILAATAIFELEPSYLVLIGICGGRIAEHIKIGDIVVPKNAFHYQYGKYKGGEIKKDLMNVDADRLTVSSVRTFLDNQCYKISDSARKSGLTMPTRTDLKVHYNSIGSADLVVDEPSKIENARTQDRKIVAVDMESYAVLKTASLLDVKGIIIKSISDIPVEDEDRASQEIYRSYARFTATEAFYKFVKETDFFLS